MKLLLITFFAFTLIFQPGSCCRKAFEYKSKTLLLKGSLNKTNWTINKNDTLYLTVNLPDTAITIEGDTISLTKINYSNYKYNISIVDSVKKVLNSSNDLQFVKIGSTQIPSYFEFDTINKPFSSQIGVVCKRKGYFLLETFIGIIGYGKDSNMNFKIDFDVPNTHINKLRPIFGNEWADEIINAERIGNRSLYAFKVE